MGVFEWLRGEKRSSVGRLEGWSNDSMTIKLIVRMASDAGKSELHLTKGHEYKIDMT